MNTDLPFKRKLEDEGEDDPYLSGEDKPGAT
jgi:hypothetical protein